MRHAWDHEHDQIGTANGLREVDRHEIDGDEALDNASRLYAALRAQRAETLGVARLQTHAITAPAEISGGRASPVSRPENRHRTRRHWLDLS
jgi:hypothetical protein